MQYLCKIFFKAKLIGRNSYKTIFFLPSNPAVSYDDDVSEYFFLVKSFKKFGKNAENTLHCINISNEAINLPVHSRQFSKRHH